MMSLGLNLRIATKTGGTDMKVSLEEIKNIAKLAKLRFDEEEALKFSEDFERILEYFNSMEKFSPVDYSMELNSENKNGATRQDIIKEYADTEELFKNAPTLEGSYIKVPKIIE
jgi:glutamyl-tRNA(Gln) and/or aspartyl-tRNA(Asn) amidotransferase, C subunit